MSERDKLANKVGFFGITGNIFLFTITFFTFGLLSFLIYTNIILFGIYLRTNGNVLI